MRQTDVAQSNATITLSRERVIVAGGTQGIGESTAYRFAKSGAEVWIIGRNETKEKIHPPPEHHFFKADLSLVSEAKRIVEAIRTRAGLRGAEYLIMTQGGPPNGTFSPKAELHDQHYAVQVLSRFILAYELTSNPNPTIKKAVMSIMSPGSNMTTLYYDDLGLLKANEQGSYGILASVSRDSCALDVFTKELASRNPNVNFTHVFPGLVKTDAIQNAGLPWYLSWLGSAFTAVKGRSSEAYSEIPFYLLANPDGRAFAATAMFSDDNLAKMEPHPSVHDADLRRKVWHNLLEALGSKK